MTPRTTMPATEMADRYVLTPYVPLENAATRLQRRRTRMMFLILLAVAFCVLVTWVVLHLGIDVVQALLAVAIMSITWRLMRRRSNMSIDDQFRHW